jgi:hypothetical protein
MLKMKVRIYACTVRINYVEMRRVAGSVFKHSAQLLFETFFVPLNAYSYLENYARDLGRNALGLYV